MSELSHTQTQWHLTERERERWTQGLCLCVCAQLCNYVSDRTTLHARHSITRTHAAEQPTPAYRGSRFTFTNLSMPHFITLRLYVFWHSLASHLVPVSIFSPHLDPVSFSFSLPTSSASYISLYLFYSHWFPPFLHPFLVLLLLLCLVAVHFLSIYLWLTISHIIFSVSFYFILCYLFSRLLLNLSQNHNYIGRSSLKFSYLTAQEKSQTTTHAK